MPKSKHKDRGPIKSVRVDRADMMFKRDSIVENDPVYTENARALNRRVASGKLSPSNGSSIRYSLAMRALGRAGVTLRESLQLMAI